MHFRYQFYFQFEFIFQCNSFYIILSYSRQKVAYNKCAKYKFTIHQIDTHDNVLKELMPLVVASSSASFDLP